jgi:threonine/homoserine/homoserine lactone efflux protein
MGIQYPRRNGYKQNVKENNIVDIWFRGLILGFSIAAPVGPIGLLCIRRTLAEGRPNGFLSGLGAASADAVYGSIAAFGLATVMTWLTGMQVWLHLFGGAFLVWLGIQSAKTPPATIAASAPNGTSLGKAYLSTFLLTLSNPMTIMSFLAIFAGSGFAPVVSGTQAALRLVLGVFCGSALWWFILSQGVHWLRRRLNELWLVWINRIAGLGLILFGLWAIGSELLRLFPG